MAAYLTPNPKMQFFDDNGDPLSGGKLYTYAAGTTTPQATYTDSTGSVENANPVILDSRGEASIWTGKARYYWTLHASDDSLVWTADNVGGGVDSDIWLVSIAGTNTITGNAVPAPSQYVLGMTFKFIAVAANTGAVTLNVSGLGAVAITKNGTSPLIADDITAGMIVTVVYDGTRCQLTNGSATVSYDSPALTGTPTAPTPAAGDNSTKIATTAYADRLLASPALTGTPTAPTAAAGTNTTQIATTAYVYGSEIGIGQTYQDVSASRTHGTTYTNSTGKPIFVSASMTSSSNNNPISGYVDGAVVVKGSGTAAGYSSQASMIVPAGSTYTFDISSYTALSTWYELR